MLRRRIDDLKKLDVAAAYLNTTGADEVVISNVRATLREVFGANSPEFHEHGDISFWHLMSISLIGQLLLANCKRVRRG